MPRSIEETYSPEETARRRDELAKRMLDMPPHPLKPLGKSKSKTGQKTRGKKKNANQCGNV